MMHVHLDGPMGRASKPSIWTTSASDGSKMAQLEHHHHLEQSPGANINVSNSNSDIKESGGTFPVKLHSMLEKVQGTPFEEIINWDPDGMSFVIYRPKEFADQLMGIYFKQTKYKSFQRQLNFYGFVRTRRGIIRGVYSHPLFQRDKPHLCQRMRRMDANNESSFDSIRQQNGVLMQNHHSSSSSSSSSSPSMMSSNHRDQQAFALGTTSSSSSSRLLESSSSLINNMHNNLSQLRRRSRQQDDDSIETIDELPFGCTPCVVTEDGSFSDNGTKF